MKIIGKIIFFLSVFLAISLSIKGQPGSIDLSNYKPNYWIENGPFELSPERGRFTLTYSIIENDSTIFDTSIAGFAAPDLGYKDGKFVSLFAPGLSYILVPGYIFGKLIGYNQFGANLVVALFALFNTCLVCSLTRRLGAKAMASFTAALVFIFATPAFSYAGSLYQHHITTFILLSSFLILLKERVNFIDLAIVFLLISSGVLIDYPNAVILFPLGVLALSKIVKFKNKKNIFKFKIRPLMFISALSVIPVIMLFFAYNKVTYGNYLQLAGTVQSVAEVKNGKPFFEGSEKEDSFVEESPEEDKSALGFFETRNLINGLYTHTISPDRGILIYAPVLLFSFIGGYMLFNKKDRYLWFFVLTVGLNVVLYSLWGDPWGGWAYGSRYLIPSYSLMAILVGISLSKIRTNKTLRLFFMIFLVYSIFVNTLGAVTSNSNLPKIEAEELTFRSGKEQKYTYFRNIDLLNEDKSKAFIYNLAGPQSINAWGYFFITLSIPTILIVFILGQYFNYFNIDLSKKVINKNKINLKN
ncbi:hypothetical protein JXA63_05295 [Candidatus Woesebacteria bacterium]|nr:hypothetical protein [Candidatus Woesebacteria bacterium]